MRRKAGKTAKRAKAARKTAAKGGRPRAKGSRRQAKARPRVVKAPARRRTAPSRAVQPAARPAAPPAEAPFRFGYCLNTGTIRQHKLGIVEEVKLAAKAGYGAIEPWIDTIQDYVAGGGSLADLGGLIADLGLKVPGAIGFPAWLVDDPARRAAALEQAKAEMELVRQIGGDGIAAPPAGWQDSPGPPVDVAAERYRALLEVGRQVGVVPQLEFWGVSPAISRLSQVAAIAVQTGCADACILPDVFHMYRGGSPFEGLRLIRGSAIRVFHFNDYPASPPREQATDADRVFPGDGVAPLTLILKDLAAGGFRGWLSLELFNPQYYQRPAAEVAAEGLAKLKAAVAKALAG